MTDRRFLFWQRWLLILGVIITAFGVALAVVRYLPHADRSGLLGSG